MLKTTLLALLVSAITATAGLADRITALSSTDFVVDLMTPPSGVQSALTLPNKLKLAGEPYLHNHALFINSHGTDKGRFVLTPDKEARFKTEGISFKDIARALGPKAALGIQKVYVSACDSGAKMNSKAILRAFPNVRVIVRVEPGTNGFEYSFDWAIFYPASMQGWLPEGPVHVVCWVTEAGELRPDHGDWQIRPFRAEYYVNGKRVRIISPATREILLEKN